MSRLLLVLSLLTLVPVPVQADGEPLEQLWLTRPANESYYDTPSIVGDRVWILHRLGDIYVLDLKSGKQVLKTKVPGDAFRGLTAGPEGVFVSCGNSVFSIDPKTGKTRWEALLGEAISKAPAVEGGQILVGTSRGHIVLLDAKTGEQVWRRKLGWYTGRVSLAGDYAFYSTSNNEEAGLYALDRKTGKTIWHVAGKGGFAIGRGVVYFGDSALRVKDGTPVWRVEMAARFWSAGRHAVIAVFGPREVAGIDPETGSDLWVHEVAGKQAIGRIPMRDAPAVVDGFVALAVEHGEVTLLDERTGKVIATKRLTQKEYTDNGFFHATPAIAKGVLLVSTSKGKTLGLRFPNASAAWTTAGGGPAQWGQAFEPDVKKLLAAPPPEDVSGLDPVKGQAELRDALSIEEPNAQVEELVAVLKQYPDTVAGHSAKKKLGPLVDSRFLRLSLRNLPKGPIGYDGPGSEVLVKRLLEAAPIDSDIIDGLFDLDDDDVLEAVVAAFWGQRAWAMERLAKNATESARKILVDRATKDPEPVVRGVAVEGLRDRTDKASKDAVKKALADDSAVVRRAGCVVAISVLGKKEGRKLLTRLSKKDPDFTVRGIAAQSLK